MPSSYLITGGSGFIGSHLAHRLVAEGAEVHIAVRPHHGSLWRLADIADRVTLHTLDLNDTSEIRACIEQAEPDCIFHLAGSTNSRRPQSDFGDVQAALTSNLTPAVALVEAAATAAAPPATIIRAGSMEEYGAGPAPFREDQREESISSYSASHIATTHFWQALQRRVPFQLTTLRVSLAFGPAQDLSFFIPSLIWACLAGMDFQMTAGTQLRDFIYIDDVIDAFLHAANTRLTEPIFNVSSGISHSVREVAELIVASAGAPIALNFAKPVDRTTDVMDVRVDSARAQRALGWTPRIELRDGIKATFAWYAKQRAQSTAADKTTFAGHNI